MPEIAIQIPEQTLTDIVARVKPLLPPWYRILLFGSWAKGTATERSDIDIAIDGPEALPRDQFSQILEALENLPTLRKVDCLDTHMVGERLREEILRTGKPLYE